MIQPQKVESSETQSVSTERGAYVSGTLPQHQLLILTLEQATQEHPVKESFFAGLLPQSNKGGARSAEHLPYHRSVGIF